MGEFATQDKAEAEQAVAARDATFHERREDEFINDGLEIGPAETTGPNAQNLMSALGHWAEWDYGVNQNTAGASKIEREQAGQPEDVTSQRLAANEIHNHYMVQDQYDLKKLAPDMVPNDKELDLSSADSRLQVLDNLVQNTANNKHGESTCAASSLVGAAVLGGGEKGTEGITNLLDAMKANADPRTLKYLEGDGQDPGAMTEIRQKIASGEQLSTGDMHMLQTELYNQLNDNETKDANARLEALNADPNATEEQKAAALKAVSAAGDGGIQQDTLKKFIGNAPGLQKMMQENEMGISFIQNDPNQRKSNHAVLTLGHGREDGAYTIYDPSMRDDGQVVMDPKELENYKKAEAEHFDA